MNQNVRIISPAMATGATGTLKTVMVANTGPTGYQGAVSPGSASGGTGPYWPVCKQVTLAQYVAQPNVFPTLIAGFTGGPGSLPVGTGLPVIIVPGYTAPA